MQQQAEQPAQPSAGGQASPTQQSPSAVPAKPPQQSPPQRPLSVTAVTTYGNVRYCDSGSARLGTQYGVMQLSGGDSGVIHWQLEGRSGGAINILRTGSATTTNKQLVYETPNLMSHSAPVVDENSALRLRITAPNDIASPWYTSQAAGDHSSCSW